jgi:hypothetical protein
MMHGSCFDSLTSVHNPNPCIHRREKILTMLTDQIRPEEFIFSLATGGKLSERIAAFFSLR